MVTDEVLLNHLPSGKHIFRGAFLEAHSHCTNTYIAVSRPETTDKTDIIVTKWRLYADNDAFLASARPVSAGKTVTNGRAMLASTGCGAKFSIALVLRETSWFIPMSRTGLPQNSAPHLCYARHTWFCTHPRHRVHAKTVFVGATMRH